MQTVTGPSDDYGRDLTQELRSLSAVQAESTRRTCTVFLRPPAVVCVIGPGSDTVLRRGSSAFSLTMRILDYNGLMDRKHVTRVKVFTQKYQISCRMTVLPIH